MPYATQKQVILILSFRFFLFFAKKETGGAIFSSQSYVPPKYEWNGNINGSRNSSINGNMSSNMNSNIKNMNSYVNSNMS